MNCWVRNDITRSLFADFPFGWFFYYYHLIITILPLQLDQRVWSHSQRRGVKQSTWDKQAAKWQKTVHGWWLTPVAYHCVSPCALLHFCNVSCALYRSKSWIPMSPWGKRKLRSFLETEIVVLRISTSLPFIYFFLIPKMHTTKIGNLYCELLYLLQNFVALVTLL